MTLARRGSASSSTTSASSLNVLAAIANEQRIRLNQQAVAANAALANQYLLQQQKKQPQAQPQRQGAFLLPRGAFSSLAFNPAAIPAMMMARSMPGAAAAIMTRAPITMAAKKPDVSRGVIAKKATVTKFTKKVASAPLKKRAVLPVVASQASVPDKPAVKVITPSEHLKKLFADCQVDPKSIPARHTKEDFVQPNATECQSYNEAVRLVRTNELDQLKSLHEQGKNLDVCNRNGESLLMVACRRGHVEMVDFLLNQVKVRWNIKDDFGRNLLHDACWRPEPSQELLDVLLQVVSPEWLLAPDIRNHTCFDYARREHAGIWCDFLKKREGTIKQRLSKVAAATA